jgi:hypothetical protein
VFTTGTPVNESVGDKPKMDRIRSAFERARRSRSAKKLERALKKALVELSRPGLLADQGGGARTAIRRGVVVIRQLLRVDVTAERRRRYLRELSRRLAMVAKGG